MLFKRPKPKTLSDQFRDAIWPRMGFMRLTKYYALRIYRLKDEPYVVAAGIASGAAVSITPFIGLHFIMAAALARILNGSIIAGLIGTFLGNPWSFPVIWYGTYKLGMFVLGNHHLIGLPIDFSLSVLLHKPYLFFIPMLIGSLPLAIITWIFVFFPARAIVIHLQHRRVRKRAKARLKEIKRHLERLENTADLLIPDRENRE